MKYGNRRRVMERQYSVRIQMSVERVSDQYRAVAGAWIGKEYERWRKTHFDAEGQYYMFGVEPKSIEN